VLDTYEKTHSYFINVLIKGKWTIFNNMNTNNATYMGKLATWLSVIEL